ncbi:SDR family oxidoreductase [Sphingorhabdus sp. SMR4y]|uniref:SDR family oxidoreductase n=1 Tax=Sphingorhabdus sp. SMR4y TaxID=2584094 RepID=UPI000B5C5724|nr:SDR family oxidoreductase [Sphingorhabdus sp. SMR4y]ASK89306.1 1,6-dihydroxycyclohexa-2,4-diene-1-carboxylate dehydrogenase [Sphingorhabdus sp. SMR4y]
MQRTWLVTGTNRGIGLEYVRQIAASGDKVIATARKPAEADELNTVKSQFPDAVEVQELDTGDAQSIAAFADRLDGRPIDILVNNAGLYGGSWSTDSERQTPLMMDYDLWEEIMKVNVMGPFRLIVALLPNLVASDRKLVVNMSSDLGSITNNKHGQSHAYRSSKAALNMITRGLAIDLAEQDVSVISMAPGWTKTDLGGDGAQWETPDSVTRQIKVIQAATPDQSGGFLNLLGEEVAW